MRTLFNKAVFKKAVLGATLAATTLTVAAPAEAQRWRRYDRGGGDAAAGAIIGGVIGLGLGAAIAGSNRDRYFDRGYYRGGYGGYDNYYQPRGYYDDGYAYNYRPRCWNDWRYDPYYGERIRVRVCN